MNKINIKGGNNMTYWDEYQNWIRSDIFDEETKKELQEIKDNSEEIK